MWPICSPIYWAAAAPPAFITALREICDQHGIMLVFDEIQTGFRRTAEWFGTDHFDVVPDVIAIGKGIANGMPLSAYGAAASVIASSAMKSSTDVFHACQCDRSLMVCLPDAES